MKVKKYKLNSYFQQLFSSKGKSNVIKSEVILCQCTLPPASLSPYNIPILITSSFTFRLECVFMCISTNLAVA